MTCVVARGEGDDKPSEEDASSGAGGCINVLCGQSGAKQDRGGSRDDEGAVWRKSGQFSSPHLRVNLDVQGAHHMSRSPGAKFSRNSTSVCASVRAVRQDASESTGVLDWIFVTLS